MTPDILLHIVSRFIHISSVVILLGGLFYARQVLVPVIETLPESDRADAAAHAQFRFRSPLFALLALIVGSGLYNFFTGPHHGRDYQIAFGIKVLLVAHIASAAILWATAPAADTAKSKRRLLGIVISGLLVVAISAYLRALSQQGL